MASQIRTKVVISAALIVIILASVASVGTTEAEDDEVSGLMIDFGYWDVDWIEMSFPEGMDGYSALRTACEMEGYEVRFRDSGELYSIDGQADLEGLSWAMYVLDEGGQWAEGDPDGDISGERLVCFARSSGASAVVPGTDQSGFTYYSYTRDGTSMSTGEPLRVATLAPSVTETVCAVGGLEYIVGTDLYSDYPAEIVEGREDGTIGTTGGYTDPNFEYIISLDPDIVFLDGGSGEQVSMADKLRKAGMDCVILYNCTDINTLYDNLWIAASALGLSENANAQINAIRHTINTVSGIAGMTNQRVLAALSDDPSPWTSGSATFMSDIITVCGGTNVFDSQSNGWFMVSKEQIYAKQPQVIIILSSTEVTIQEQYEAILDGLDPLWKQTPAYQNGNVYVFSGDAADIFQRPGPRLAEAAELLCKILNPEAFERIDPLDVVPNWFGNDYATYLTYQSEAGS